MLFRVLFLVATFVVCSFGHSNQKIIGGGDVLDIQTVPFVVSVRYLGSHVCGGSIITVQHVITAAECTYKRSATDLTVHSGSRYLNGNAQVHEVYLNYVNPKYNELTRDYDVAIVKVRTKFSTFDPVVISNFDLPPTFVSKIFGWGITTVGVEVLPPILQTRDVKILDRLTCKQKYDGRPGIVISDTTMMCADEGPCTGDFGGPLIYTSSSMVNYIVAVSMKSGQVCGSADFPSVHFKLSEVRPWIKSIAGV